MSVKIYGGLIAKESDPFKVAKSIRAVLEPAFFRKFNEIRKEMKISFDRLTEAGQSEITFSQLSDKFWECSAKAHPHTLDRDLYEEMKKLHHSSRHTFSDADIFYDVSIIENMNKDGNPLILIFGEESDYYRELLLKNSVVTDYGYWDNTDREDSVSEDDWLLRKKAWGLLVEKDFAPNQVGLGFSNPSSMSTVLSLLK